MTFGGFDESRHAAPMAEINVTPMVDVMLVLLVIFILAAPLFTHGLRLDLPGAASAPLPAPPATVVLSIDAAGKLFWNDDAIAPGALATRMATAAAQTPQPDLQLRADRATRYEVIAEVLSTAQANNLLKIGFVTEPKPAADAAPRKAAQPLPPAASFSSASETSAAPAASARISAAAPLASSLPAAPPSAGAQAAPVAPPSTPLTGK